MAAIKIAQLTSQLTLNDTDTLIVETATSTNKMSVGTFKELLGVNAKAPIANPEFTGYAKLNGLKSTTRLVNDSGGGAILASEYELQSGFLFVSEIGTAKFLTASFFKVSTETPVITVLQSNGLTLGVSNAVGTQIINGATVNANVRMKALIYDLSV